MFLVMVYRLAFLIKGINAVYWLSCGHTLVISLDPEMKLSTTWLPDRCLNFVHLGPLLCNMYLVWPLGMLGCHIKPAACINTHLTPAEGSFPLLDAGHLIRETETWALSNLSASLHPSPLVLHHSCHRTTHNIFSHNFFCFFLVEEL